MQFHDKFRPKMIKYETNSQARISAMLNNMMYRETYTFMNDYG